MNNEPIDETIKEKYYPGSIPEVVREDGICDPSFLLTRKDALRCIVGDNIYDPCFAVLDPIMGLVDNPIIVCRTYPQDESRSISIQASHTIYHPEDREAIPAGKADIMAWIFELQDGRISTFGALMYAPRDGETVYRYYCGDEGQDGIWAGDLTQDQVWQAKVVRRTKEKGGLRNFEMAKIRKVWY